MKVQAVTMFAGYFLHFQVTKRTQRNAARDLKILIERGKQNTAHGFPVFTQVDHERNLMTRAGVAAPFFAVVIRAYDMPNGINMNGKVSLLKRQIETFFKCPVDVSKTQDVSGQQSALFKPIEKTKLN